MTRADRQPQQREERMPSETGWIARASAAARAKAGCSEDWHGWLYEAVPDGGGVLVTGAACPLKTKGREIGKPNFRKRDRSTERRVWLSSDDLAAIDKTIQADLTDAGRAALATGGTDAQ